MNKQIIKVIAFLIAILVTIATIVFVVLTNVYADYPLLENIFKISITVSLTINLSLCITINYASINNSFNTINYNSSLDNIKSCLENCYLIYTNVVLMIESFDNYEIGTNIEKDINSCLQRVKSYCDNIKAKISIYTNDFSITINDQYRVNFVKEYVDAVACLESYIPFRWIKAKNIEQKNEEMKRVLVLLKDKYLLFENKQKTKEV